MKISARNKDWLRIEKAMDNWPGYDLLPDPRYSLARNLKKVKAHTELIEKVRQDTVKQHLNGAEKLEGEPLNKFMEVFGEFLDKPAEVDIFQIKRSDMNLEKNAIPIGVLEPLLDVVIVDGSSQ